MQGVGVLCGAGGSTGIHREASVIELVQLYEAVCLRAELRSLCVKQLSAELRVGLRGPLRAAGACGAPCWSIGVMLW